MAIPISTEQEIRDAIAEAEELLHGNVREQAHRLLVAVLKTDPPIIEGRPYDSMMAVGGNNAYVTACRLLDSL